MAINAYIREGWDGVETKGLGEDGWHGVITHDDIMVSGRVKALTVVSDGHPLRVDLTPDDILTFIRRTRLYGAMGEDHGSGEGPRYIFGKRKVPETTIGAFYVVWPNGEVQVSRNTDEA